jgi:hypothetical protein
MGRSKPSLLKVLSSKGLMSPKASPSLFPNFKQASRKCTRMVPIWGTQDNSNDITL